MYQINQFHIGHIRAVCQRSIRLNPETVSIIERVPGRSFSDKVRNMAYDYKKLKEEVGCNTKSSGR